MKLKKILTAVICMGFVFSCSSIMAKTDQLRVVGSWSSLTLYKNFEKPFWTETVPKELGLKTTMTSLGQVKLKGPAVVRQMDMGVFDVVHT
ncbi:MAG: hypothetical protein KAI39_09795, partial [Desulfobulbaceae bacterium]|nr:hypothetical protein [Desulfobulbaceae bacterium]